MSKNKKLPRIRSEHYNYCSEAEAKDNIYRVKELIADAMLEFVKKKKKDKLDKRE